MTLTPRSSSTITWRTLLWFFATIVALLAFGFWLGIVPVADANGADKWRIVITYTDGPRLTIYVTGTEDECEAFRVAWAGSGKLVGPCVPEKAALVTPPIVYVDPQSSVVEPADIPPATDDPVQNEHWTDVPPVPAGAPDVERNRTCGSADFGFVVRLWKTPRYAQYLPVVDGETGAVIATLLFDESDLSLAKAVYVSLPGRAVERMTGEQLVERWPHPCYMVQAVVGMRT